MLVRISFYISGHYAQLSELQDTAGKPTLDVTRERLQHLMAVETLQTTGSLDFSRWADTRLDRWLVDWALRTGRENTARTLAQDRNIEVCSSAKCSHQLMAFTVCNRPLWTSICSQTSEESNWHFPSTAALKHWRGVARTRRRCEKLR